MALCHIWEKPFVNYYFLSRDIPITDEEVIFFPNEGWEIHSSPLQKLILYFTKLFRGVYILSCDVPITHDEIFFFKSGIGDLFSSFVKLQLIQHFTKPPPSFGVVAFYHVMFQSRKTPTFRKISFSQVCEKTPTFRKISLHILFLI